MERRFPRSFAALAEIFEYTREFYAREGLDDGCRNAVDLAVEEIFTNMVKYHADHAQPIAIEIEREADRVVVTLTDFDVERFDVNRAAEVRTDAPLAERPIGGLGLHLVRKMMDEIDYDYTDRRSRVRLVKKLG